MNQRLVVVLGLLCLVTAGATAQSRGDQRSGTAAQQKKRPPFKWVNPPRRSVPHVTHHTFRSPSMNVDVGYCIYLPSAYKASQNAERRFPVVYYLHGGRPGSEIKSIGLIRQMHPIIESGKVPPMIYVFVNGGPVSHYDMPGRADAQGATVFVRELIPHIDATWRTIAERRGRGIEGFSQGGRGTTRIMFRHPELFASAAPGGGGFATEKRISEEGGRESPTLQFSPGDNTWDLARAYAAKSDAPPLKILVHVGTKGFNYENNLQYMDFLKSLKIQFDSVIVDGAPHSAQKIYEKRGLEIMQFHAQNLARE